MCVCARARYDSETNSSVTFITQLSAFLDPTVRWARGFYFCCLSGSSIVFPQSTSPQEKWGNLSTLEQAIPFLGVQWALHMRPTKRALESPRELGFPRSGETNQPDVVSIWLALLSALVTSHLLSPETLDSLDAHWAVLLLFLPRLHHLVSEQGQALCHIIHSLSSITLCRLDRPPWSRLL